MRARWALPVTVAVLVLVAVVGYAVVKSAFLGLTHPMLQINNGTVQFDDTALQAPYSGAANWGIDTVGDRSITVNVGGATRTYHMSSGTIVIDSPATKVQMAYAPGKPAPANLCPLGGLSGFVTTFGLTHPMAMVSPDSSGHPAWIVSTNALAVAGLDSTVVTIDDAADKLHGALFLVRNSNEVGLYLRDLAVGPPFPANPTVTLQAYLPAC